MRQSLLGEEVEREGGASVVGNALGLGPQLGLERVGVGVGGGAQEVGRIPEIPLPLMQLHELAALDPRGLSGLRLWIRVRARGR